MGEDSAFGTGLFIGIVLTAIAALYESDSANIHEYKYGVMVCQKNGGFQYFEKRWLKDYTYVCRDKAQFRASDNDIYKTAGAWTDDTIVEEKAE